MVNWAGLRVLNTRPHGQNQALSQAIREAGGVPIEYPVLSIEPVYHDWKHLFHDDSNVDAIIFTSTNAVCHFFSQLNAQKLVCPDAHLIAIGDATARALGTHGIKVNDIPLLSSSEGLLALDALQHVQEKRIWIIKGQGGRDLLAKILSLRGASVELLEVYRRVCPDADDLFLQSLWREDGVDAIVITSEEALHNVFKLFGEAAHDWLCSKKYYVKSERLAKAAADLGIKKIMITIH